MNAMLRWSLQARSAPRPRLFNANSGGKFGGNKKRPSKQPPPPPPPPLPPSASPPTSSSKASSKPTPSSGAPPQPTASPAPHSSAASPANTSTSSNSAPIAAGSTSSASAPPSASSPGTAVSGSTAASSAAAGGAAAARTSAPASGSSATGQSGASSAHQQHSGSFFGRLVKGTFISLPFAFLAGLYSSADFRAKAWHTTPQLMGVIEKLYPDLTRIPSTNIADEPDDYEQRDTELGNDLEEGVQKDVFVIEEVKSAPTDGVVKSRSPHKISDVQAHEKSSEEIEREIQSRLQQHENTLTKEFEKTVNKRVAAKLEQERARLEQQHLEHLKQQADDLNSHWEKVLVQQHDDIWEGFRMEREDRLQRMQEIEAQADKTKRILQWHAQHQKLGHHVHKLTGAVLMLEQVLKASEPLGQPWEQVKSLAEGDDVVTAVIDSVPEAVVQTGLPTVRQLQKRFESVVNSCRRGALVPADSGIMGHLLAGTVSALLVEQRFLVKGKDELSKLSRASFFVSRGDLPSAMKELSLLDPEGLPAKLCRDWLRDAEARVSTEMAIRLLKSHAAELASNMQL